MDEKTSIQARGRCHEEMPPEPQQTRRIETGNRSPDSRKTGAAAGRPVP
jgi:hypothetical protein